MGARISRGVSTPAAEEEAGSACCGARSQKGAGAAWQPAVVRGAAEASASSAPKRPRVSEEEPTGGAAASGEPVGFSIFFPNGSKTDVSVLAGETVRAIRAKVEEERPPPPACLTKIFQAGKLLLDDTPVSTLEPGQPVFAVVARETRLEVLLQAAGSYQFYEDMLRNAELEAPNVRTVSEVPCILDVLEDMAGQPASIESLKRSEIGPEGTLEFSGGRDGDRERRHATQAQLILPSLDVTPLLREHGVETFKMVTISVEVNSDAYNNGLGVVLEASPLMDCTVDEHGLPSYVYNGAGLSRDKKRSAVKFHPGMHGGMLRVEGTGGFGNSGVGFLPESWTGAARKFHTLRLTLGANGENLVRIDGAQEGQSWSNPWKHQLTEGRYTPAVYAWLDMVSINRPLFIGKITMQFHMEQ